MSTKLYTAIAVILICILIAFFGFSLKEFDKCNTTQPPLPLGLAYGMEKETVIHLLNDIFVSEHSLIDDDGVLQFSEINKQDSEEFEIITLMFIKDLLVSAWFTRRMPENIKTFQDATKKANLWRIEFDALMGASGERSFKPFTDETSWVFSNGEDRSFCIDSSDGIIVVTQKYTCDSAVKALN